MIGSLRTMLTVGSLAMLSLAASPLLAGEDHGTLPSDEQRPIRWWNQLPEWQSLVTTGAFQEGDPGGDDLRGLRIGWGGWAEMGPIFTGGLIAWVEGSQGENQKILGAGVGLEGLCLPPMGPVRILPRVKLGTEHRQEAPHDGWAVFIGVGGEVAVWITPHWQAVAAVDRDLAYPSGASTQIAFELRYAWEPR